MAGFSSFRGTSSILKVHSCCKLYALPLPSNGFNVCHLQQLRPFHQRIVQRVDDYLATNFPRVSRIQRLVMGGSKACVTDLKAFVLLKRDLARGRQLSTLSRSELEVLMLTPQDIEKLLAITVIVILPMTVFLLAVAFVLFPRQLLTRHFWTQKQHAQFFETSLKNHRKHYKPVLELLVALCNEKKLLPPFSLSPPVDPRRLCELLPLYQQEPLHIRHLAWYHRYHLANMYGLFPFLGTKRSLRQRAELLNAHNVQLFRAGAVEALREEDLVLACFLRQINYASLSPEECRRALLDWIGAFELTPTVVAAATGFDEAAKRSLLIHAPALLSK